MMRKLKTVASCGREGMRADGKGAPGNFLVMLLFKNSLTQIQFMYHAIQA